MLPKRPKYGPRRRAGLRRRAARVRHEPPRLTSLVTRRLAARRRPAAAVVALRGRYHAAARPARGYAVREQGLQNGCDCERSSGPRRRVACRARATACAAFRTCLGPTRAEGRDSNSSDFEDVSRLAAVATSVLRRCSRCISIVPLRSCPLSICYPPGWWRGRGAARCADLVLGFVTLSRVSAQLAAAVRVPRGALTRARGRIRHQRCWQLAGSLAVEAASRASAPL